MSHTKLLVWSKEDWEGSFMHHASTLLCNNGQKTVTSFH